MHNIDDTEHILQVLNRSYSLVFDRLTFLRDSGSRSFQAHTGNEMYFLRVTKPAFADTALQSIDVHVYLQNQGFPLMDRYDGSLVRHQRWFFLDRYLEIRRKKQYPKTDEFAVYGEALWNRLRTLPASPCHVDLYSGNIHDWIALYHFALEATIIEIHGLDCVDNAFLDHQLFWLEQWRKQCDKTA